MIVSFTIPSQYIARLKAAFEVDTEDEFKEKIRGVVKDTVQLFEEDAAVQTARENSTIESDFIT